jgi:hypothetical protein
VSKYGFNDFRGSTRIFAVQDAREHDAMIAMDRSR